MFFSLFLKIRSRAKLEIVVEQWQKKIGIFNLHPKIAFGTDQGVSQRDSQLPRCREEK